MAFGSYKNTTPQSEDVQQTAQRQLSQQTPQQKMQPVAPASDSLHPDNLLQLQRTIGNRMVQRLLGENATPQETFSAFQQRVTMPIQAKLTVTPANDKYEAEADAVANQVMQTMRANPVQRMDDEDMMMQRMDDEDMMMQRDFANGGAVDNDVESQIMAARGGGQALADNVRAPMENAFNADFSNVRVHTGSQSDSLNRSVQARAFTTGSDIFFRSGEYSPASNSGQRLLAHELTHVVQQGASGQRKIDKKKAQ